MDVLETILSIDKPSFIYVSGELVVERWLNENVKKGKFYYDDDTFNPDCDEERTIKMFEDSKIEIYIDASDSNWDLQKTITYCKNLYDNIEDPIFDLDDDDFMPIVYYLNEFIHNIGEAVKINTINNLYPEFGFGEDCIKYKIDKEDGRCKHWKTKNSIVVHTIGLQSYLIHKIIIVKFILCFNGVKKTLDYPLDIFGMFLNSKSEYTLIQSENYNINAFESKNAILSLDKLNKDIFKLGEYISAKYVYRLIKKTTYLISIGWRIYLKYKECDCIENSCMCKIRIDKKEVSSIINGIATANYYFGKNIKVDRYYNILELQQGKWMRSFRRSNDYIIVDRNDESELKNYIIYSTILNKIILNHEFLLYTLSPKHFLKFHAYDWY